MRRSWLRKNRRTPPGGAIPQGVWFWVGGLGLSRILLVELRSGGLGQTERDDRRAVFARRSLLGITQGDKVSLQLWGHYFVATTLRLLRREFMLSLPTKRGGECGYGDACSRRFGCRC